MGSDPATGSPDGTHSFGAAGVHHGDLRTAPEMAGPVSGAGRRVCRCSLQSMRLTEYSVDESPPFDCRENAAWADARSDYWAALACHEAGHAVVLVRRRSLSGGLLGAVLLLEGSASGGTGRVSVRGSVLGSGAIPDRIDYIVGGPRAQRAYCIRHLGIGTPPDLPGGQCDVADLEKLCKQFPGEVTKSAIEEAILRVDDELRDEAVWNAVCRVGRALRGASAMQGWAAPDWVFEGWSSEGRARLQDRQCRFLHAHEINKLIGATTTR